MNLTFDRIGYKMDETDQFMISGEFHYFRVPQADWKRRMRLYKEAGGNCLATYVPWLIHEPEEGNILFGDIPQRDLAGFLETAREEGLRVVLRPGPLQYSELIYGGIPQWIHEKYPELQAQKVTGESFEAVSYLHPVFLEKARTYYKAFADVIRPYMNNPVVMVQVDNEATGTHVWKGSLDYNVETMGIGMESGRYPCFLKKMDKTHEQYEELKRVLNNALNCVCWDDDSFYESIDRAYETLMTELASMKKYTDVTVHAVGRTHIDVAWKWRLKHTREKAQRYFSTVLRLMDRNDEYIFLQSQPQLYQYIKEDCPELYSGIKERIAEGRWEPDGGMWLEADCNITSGESLVRQLLHGTRFMEREFGKKCEYLWLPDVFGYSWALPQILKLCEIDTFMTTKIGWNQYNTIPNDLFRWRGIDGTEILTYFIDVPTEGHRYPTYNSKLTPYEVDASWKAFKNKELTKDVLVCYGYGDGGGGATRDMLEMRRAMEAIPGIPHVKTGTASILPGTS